MKQPIIAEKQETKKEKLLRILKELFEKTDIQYILLALSSVFVVFSIIYGRYFLQTFLTFIYSVLFVQIQIARKQESVENWKKDWKLLYHVCLYVLFILSIFLWIILTFKSFSII